MAGETDGILIVDDDKGFTAFVEATLVEAGYRCRTAERGELALAAARSEQPVIVLLDVYLPTISGYDVCRRLRERHGLGIGIIFVSGERTEPYDRVAGLELGGDDYLLKPLDAGELVARLRAVLRRVRRTEAATTERTQPERGLTPRECEVLALAAEGMAQKEIARQLAISRKTVGSHMGHIFEKLGVHSQGQAVVAAREMRIITPLASARLASRTGSAGTEALTSALLLGLPVSPMSEIMADAT
jgi:DNA-binding NarL/FixJ family response regulator